MIDGPAPIRSGWPRAFVGKRLTDKKIAKYEKLGYYDPAWQQARRELWKSRAEKRKTLQERREGNFINRDGKLIFSPL